MKVTCGSCFATLRVEDWLADNVARCPKCDQVIQIPPANSPDGANAVVLTVEEAADLLRRRVSSGQIPSIGGAAAPSGGVARRPGPKTEPLPAFLRQAAPAIHEEPEKKKTRPLPRPVGRPSPALPSVPGATPSPPAPVAPTPGMPPEPFKEPGAPPARRGRLFSPLVPAAFMLGVLIGAACGWWIGRSHRGEPRAVVQQVAQVPPSPPHAGRPPGQPGQPAAQPTPDAVTPTTMAAHQPAVPPTTQPHATTQPVTPPVATTQPAVKRSDWLPAQPPSPKVAIEQDNHQVTVVRRVAAITDSYPATNLYYPAPPHQVYTEVTVQLVWQATDPVTFKLGGPQADCWLLCRDGRVFHPRGQPRAVVQRGQADPVADPQAQVTLDKSNPVAKVTVLFLVPAQLPATRIAFTDSQFADLPAPPATDADPTGGRTPDGKWDSIPVQLFAQAYPEDRKIIDALAKADRPNELIIEHQPDGDYKLTIEKAQITATMKATREKDCYDATLKMGQIEAKATVRLFDRGRQLLIYLGPGQFMQCAYQRAEQTFFGL